MPTLPGLLAALAVAATLCTNVAVAEQVEAIAGDAGYVVIRTAPGDESATAGILAPGERAELLGTVEAWHLIRRGTETGFVPVGDVRVIPLDAGAGEDAIQRAVEAAHADLDKQIEANSDFMSMLLRVLTIVLAVLALFGLGAAAQNFFIGRRTSTALDDAESALEHVDKIRKGLKDLWKNAEELADRATLPTSPWTATESPIVEPKSKVAWQDFENLLVWADTFRINAEDKQTAVHYLRLADALRLQLRFADSAVRAERSIELDPGKWEAHRALADALVFWVDDNLEKSDGDDKTDLDYNRHLLSRALAAAERAEKLWNRTNPRCPNTLGWVYDTMGKLEGDKAHHERAAEYFEIATRLERNRAEETGSRYDTTYQYNLMCALVGAGDENFAKVCEVAQDSVRRGMDLESRLGDPDLEPLLEDPEWGPTLRKVAVSRPGA